ncbi:hypothetical protein GCM10010293_60680 [Streptomyces griseoflavus]|nr:hypothetical protein GCM10010293_60680 [Streptomyces griseoflavus]
MLGEDLSLVMLRNTLRGAVIPLTRRDATMTDPVPVRNRTEINHSAEGAAPGAGGARAGPSCPRPPRPPPCAARRRRRSGVCAFMNAMCAHPVDAKGISGGLPADHGRKRGGARSRT